MYLSPPPLPRLTFLGWEIEDRRSPWRISKLLITRRYLWWVLDFDFFCNNIMEISIVHSLGWYSALYWLHLLLQMVSEKGSLPSAPHGFIFHLTLGQSVSQFSRSVMSDSLPPHESQHARPPCPSQTPGVYSNSCPSSQWCHPAILFSVVPFSSCPQSLPASRSFPMSQLFAWDGQSIGVSASANFG